MGRLSDAERATGRLTLNFEEVFVEKIGSKFGVVVFVSGSLSCNKKQRWKKDVSENNGKKGGVVDGSLRRSTSTANMERHTHRTVKSNHQPTNHDNHKDRMKFSHPP